MYTPLDLQKLDFKKGFRGYNSEEIDDFIEKIKKDYESLFKENAQLKEEVLESREKLKKYQEMEDTLKNALVLAQQTSEDLKNTASKERDIIINEAHVLAKKIIAEANQKVVDINRQFEECRKNLLIFRTRFVNFLQAQLELLHSDDLLSMAEHENREISNNG
jgi:cell division initiation protein